MTMQKDTVTYTFRDSLLICYLPFTLLVSK